MGEYYNWINVDKRQYICPADFDCGNKYYETLHKDNVLLQSLHVLLNDEWKGDHIIWFGDEKLVSKNSSVDVLRILYEQSVEHGYPEDVFDTICESYINVSCFFKEAEECVRENIEDYLSDLKNPYLPDFYNEYDIDFNNPFNGLFKKTCKRFLYTINHSKKLYYSVDQTRILYKDGTICDYVDPLPLLMGYGRIAEPAEWLGDVVGVSDEKPKGYESLKEIYLSW